jgi:CSLREA domain-containing protein
MLRLVPVLLIAILATLGLFVSPFGRETSAEELTVDSTADATDTSPGDGVCFTAAGACTLRAAIQEANASDGDDMIALPAGTITFALAGAGDGSAATGDLDVTSNLTIAGEGPSLTRIDAAMLDRAFDIHAGAVVEIRSLAVVNGEAGPLDGGAIANGGTLVLDNVLLDNNHADDGGAVVNAGLLTIVDSTLVNNRASDVGGAINNQQALTIRNTAIDGNSAPFGGGGVNNLEDLSMSEASLIDNRSTSGNGAGLSSFGEAVLTNVTASGNSTNLNGGGIATAGALTLVNATLANNSAGIDGAAVYLDEAAAAFRNVIVAGNHGVNCGGSGGFITNGHNLEDADTCAFGNVGDLVNTDPLIGPVAANGGPTSTHALTAGSPAIDGGDSIGCPPIDQRGVTRPQDGDGEGEASCDIGAFEFVSGAVDTPTPGATPTATPTPLADITPVPPTPTRTRTPTPAATPSVYATGDANCDRQISSIDAALVLQRVAGLLSPAQLAQFADCRPDANEDASVNSIDAALILQYTAGLLDQLPP